MPRTTKGPIKVLFVSGSGHSFEQAKPILAARFGRNKQNLAEVAEVHFEHSSHVSESFIQSLIDKKPHAVVFDSFNEDGWYKFEQIVIKKNTAAPPKFFYSFNGNTLWILGANGVMTVVEESNPDTIVNH